MNMADLEEALAEILPTGFRIETNSNGQIIVCTGLAFDENDEIVDFEGEDDEDLELDPDLEPLEEDLDEEE